MSNIDIVIQNFLCGEATRQNCQKLPPHFCPLNKEPKELTLEKFEQWKQAKIAKKVSIENQKNGTDPFVHQWLDISDEVISVNCDLCSTCPIVGIRFMALIINHRTKEVVGSFDVCQNCWSTKKDKFQNKHTKHTLFFSIRCKLDPILLSSIIEGDFGRCYNGTQKKVVWNLERPDMKSPPLQCVDCSCSIQKTMHHCYFCENSYYCDTCFLKHITFPQGQHKEHLFISVPQITDNIAQDPKSYIESVINGTVF
jgi:hypothetical protein